MSLFLVLVICLWDVLLLPKQMKMDKSSVADTLEEQRSDSSRQDVPLWSMLLKGLLLFGNVVTVIGFNVFYLWVYLNRSNDAAFATQVYYLFQLAGL